MLQVYNFVRQIECLWINLRITFINQKLNFIIHILRIHALQHFNLFLSFFESYFYFLQSFYCFNCLLIWGNSLRHFGSIATHIVLFLSYLDNFGKTAHWESFLLLLFLFFCQNLFDFGVLCDWAVVNTFYCLRIL